MASIQPVILCGGAGTRLWPLSRKAYPKQFVPLVHDKSLLALTLERVAALAGPSRGVMCVGAEEHRFFLQEAVRTAGLRGDLLLEPVARNTAAAMALAALCVGDPEQLLLFCPADHLIPDAAAFKRMVLEATTCAEQGAIVTFGVSPTFPSTGYGYVEKGLEQPGGGYRVARFIEKPDATRALELLASGNVLWNAGIFLCRASTLLRALDQHAPDIARACRAAMQAASRDGDFLRPAAEPFQSCRSESIDFAVMEHHDDVAVFPFEGQWSDVGSWAAVAEIYPADAQGNRVFGQALVMDGTDNFVHAPHRQVVALGTDGLIIVDTPDALLVSTRAAAEQVKSVVAQLEVTGRPEAVSHRKVLRPWGSYDCLEAGERFQVKRIVVNPGASLSLQKHFHRAEHWIVVRGTAEVVRGGETFLLSENQSTYIPLGELHRLRNPGRTPLEMIEVQSGSYLGEDDIVRVDDQYGRTIEGKQQQG